MRIFSCFFGLTQIVDFGARLTDDSDQTIATSTGRVQAGILAKAYVHICPLPGRQPVPKVRCPSSDRSATGKRVSIAQVGIMDYALAKYQARDLERSTTA